jgi:hypothetical protein
MVSMVAAKGNALLDTLQMNSISAAAANLQCWASTEQLFVSGRLAYAAVALHTYEWVEKEVWEQNAIAM